MRLLVALGGALLPRGAVPDASVQIEHVTAVAPALAAVAQHHDVVITHGNGPQVGLLALESDDDESLSRPYPLDALVAETQGLIGYWLQRSLAAAGLTRPVVSLVTQTVVDGADPAFSAPTKFVGAAYGEDEARALAAARGWTVAADGDRWRRVVASPEPLRVVETPTVAQLLGSGTTVICAGGGGVPVAGTTDDTPGGTTDGRTGGLAGVEAVVDKDSVAALLAVALDVEQLVLLTDVPAVMVGYGTPEARALGDISVAELGELAFPAGSMGPKVTAACAFADATGRTAAIGALDDLDRILAGAAGTRVRA
ncbi:MAG: carbamate kinase [Acidimicrobiales bacterium]